MVVAVIWSSQRGVFTAVGNARDLVGAGLVPARPAPSGAGNHYRLVLKSHGPP